jgi:hypothetical protein
MMHEKLRNPSAVMTDTVVVFFIRTRIVLWTVDCEAFGAQVAN